MAKNVATKRVLAYQCFMERLDLTCFGTADGMPCADRNNSAYLYQLGRAWILLDCGEPLCRSYKDAGLSFNRLDSLVLSHLHADHLGGLFMFVQGLWLEKRRRALTLHLPADGIQPIRDLLEAGCLCEEILPFRLELAPLGDRQSFAVMGTRVTPFLNTHLEGLKRRLQPKHALRFESFSFLLETNHFRVAHSADIGEVADLEPLVEKPLDLLVCEMSHFRPEALCEYLQGRPVRSLALVHFGRPQWKRLEQIRKLVRRHLPNLPALYPKDGQVIRLLPAAG
jgi:ribonuclease BN (tRNA processing enzyme)